MRGGAEVPREASCSARISARISSPLRARWQGSRRSNAENLHEARHTFASYMIAAGVNAKALSTYMGHANIAITLDRYGHLIPGNENEAAGLLDAYLESAATKGATRADWIRGGWNVSAPPSHSRRGRGRGRIGRFLRRSRIGVYTGDRRLRAGSPWGVSPIARGNW